MYITTHSVFIVEGDSRLILLNFFKRIGLVYKNLTANTFF